MSIDIMNRIWYRDWEGDVAPIAETHPGSGKNLKWTLLAMADMASDDGFCWPAVETVARKASLSPRAVQMALRQAEVIGVLRRRQRRDASTQYVFVLTALPNVERPSRSKERGPIDWFNAEEDEPDLFDTGAGGAPVKKTGVHGVRPTGAGDSLTGAGGAPRNVIEPSLETSDSGDFEKSPATPSESLTEFIERRWAEIVATNPDIASIRKIDDSLGKTMLARAKSHAVGMETPFDVWSAALDRIGESTFLRGRAPPGPGRDRPFRLSIGWMTKATNFREILGGRYSDRSNDQGGRNGAYPVTDPASGRRLGPTAQALHGSLERLHAARRQGGHGGNPGSDLAHPG